MELPALGAWLRKAAPDHPFHDLLNEGSGTEFGVALDRILGRLDELSPKRLGDKRKAFASELHEARLREQCVELLAAYVLADKGIEFDFGNPSPDLVSRSMPQVGVEVGARSKDDIVELCDEIDLVLLAKGAPVAVDLTFSYRPLSLSADNRAILRTGVPDAVAAAEGVARVVHFQLKESPPPWRRQPNDPRLLDVRVKIEFDINVVHVSHGVAKGSLEIHLQDVEGQLMNKLAEKRRQAKHMPALLFVEASNLGLSWLRPEQVWAAEFEAMRKKLFASTDFAGVAIAFANLIGLGFEGTYVLRDGLPPDPRDRLDTMAWALFRSSPTHLD